MKLPPLALYIHIPWCVQKCPYCDFNSHGIKAKTINPDGSAPEMANIDEQAYVQHLLADLKADLKYVQNRPIDAIFFGGGTPSIFSPESIKQIIQGVGELVTLAPDCEITLEANPGTVDQHKFKGFYQAGITRLSIGIQSFNSEHLKVLGRIHDTEQAKFAVQAAKDAGFKKVNVDLMFGLPNQTIDQALADLQQAVSLEPTHLSWYQLTIEPNTLFYSRPPKLPDDEYIWDIEVAGKAYLAEQGFGQYEVSAYAKGLDQRCRHNQYYWKFYDYLGIGCGAAGKITTLDGIYRTTKTKHPKGYMQGNYLHTYHKVEKEDLLFEYFLNRLRLFAEPCPKSEFSQLTGLSQDQANKKLQKYINQGLIQQSDTHWWLTDLGKQYLNSILVDLLD